MYNQCAKCGASYPKPDWRSWCQDCRDEVKRKRLERKRRREAKELMDIRYIYILIDPRTSQPRYVGIAANWRRRLAQHILDAKKGRGDNPNKDSWIMSLVDAGLKPLMLLVWRGHEYEVLDREKETYVLLTEQGYDLFNASFNQAIPRKLGY